jgi:hypothetical protein
MRRLISFAIAFTASYALAQTPRIEIKGVPLGLAPDAYAETFNGQLRCHDAQCFAPPGAHIHFGSAIVDNANFDLIDGKVESVTLFIQERDFADLAAALTEKYGKPAEDHDAPVQNRLGATFHNRAAVWDLPDGTIVASQHAGDLDHGAVMFSSAKSRKAAADRSVSKPKQDAKGL